MTANQTTYAYTVAFPREPIRAILRRIRAAGFRYRRPLDPFAMGHCGSGGIWQGQLTEAEFDALQLPAGTRIKRD